METVSKTKKKTGRPGKVIKRHIKKTIRFATTEYFVVKENAGKAGINISEFIRQIAIYATVKSRLTEEERQMVRALVGMANNVNQIAKACHREGVLQAMYYFQSIVKQLDEILKKFKK